MDKTRSTKKNPHRVVGVFLLTVLMAACGTLNPKATPRAEFTPGADAAVTAAPALPGVFQSARLNPLDTPHTYLEETCPYLRRKWDSFNAEPGTVVMIIMFHEIKRGPLESAQGTNVFDFDKLMSKLSDQGFSAITMKQFLGFMERNVKIPFRSVLIIQDGSYPAENFNKNFREYWENWRWPVISAWTSDPNLSESAWDASAALEREGWVDHEAQGVIPDTLLSDDTSKAVITRELQGSLSAFADRFGKIPYAYIWPGGVFGLRPVTAARQLGYQLGFTANARGPVMYNWVPLAEQVDPARPTYLPEGPINDPLMTLPRYAPEQVLDAIDSVRNLGKEAAAYAAASKVEEFAYYEAVCRPVYGPIPVR